MSLGNVMKQAMMSFRTFLEHFWWKFILERQH